KGLPVFRKIRSPELLEEPFKLRDELSPLLYRLLEFAGDRSKLLVGVQPIQYLPFVLDRDLTSGDDLEFLIAGEKPHGAVSISFNGVCGGRFQINLIFVNRRAVMNESVSPRDN